MKKDIDLMCLYWTTAGVYPGRGEISRFDFKDRTEAAARAGFKGLGLWHTELEHIQVHRSLKEIRQILDDNGMRYLELEFLTDWFLEGGRRSESDSRKRRLLEASAALGATHVKVGDFYNCKVPMSRMVDSFAALCAEAEAYGTRIGFEVMGCAMIDNLPDAIHLVQESGVGNGGLIIDIYQFSNQGWSFEDIRRIPLQYLMGVELNDGTLPGSPDHDPSNRCYCGQGEYDIRGLIDCVRQMGYSGPWAVELISEKLIDLPLEEVSRRAFDTTMAVLIE